MKWSIERCAQCKERILPGDLYLDEQLEGERVLLHQECSELWEEDEERRNFWFDYVVPDDHKKERSCQEPYE